MTVAQASSSARNELQRIVQEIEANTFVEIVPAYLIKTAGYCRPASETRVDQMIRRGFSFQKFGLIYLSMQPDGTYHILDGYHRLQVVRKLQINEVPARVFIDLTYEQEAELFREFNSVKRTTAMDLFRADVEAKNPDALEIKRIIESVGMKVGLMGPGYPATVSSIAACQKAYADLGSEGFQQICQILYDAWGQERRAWVHAMMDGLRQFWGRYRTEVDRKSLVDRMKLVTPEKLIAEAGVVTSSTRGASAGSLIGKKLVEYYNRNRREHNQLSEWRITFGPNPLYTGTSRYQHGAFHPYAEKQTAAPSSHTEDNPAF